MALQRDLGCQVSFRPTRLAGTQRRQEGSCRKSITPACTHTHTHTEMLPNQHSEHVRTQAEPHKTDWYYGVRTKTHTAIIQEPAAQTQMHINTHTLVLIKEVFISLSQTVTVCVVWVQKDSSSCFLSCFL